MASRILLVDDDAEFCKAIKTALESNDYIVVIAENGQRAWQQFQEHKFTLILLDLMLPDADGLDLCQRFRQHSHVPIFVTSARQDQGDRMAALEVGADGYLAKPFETRELLARIAAALRRAEEYSGTGVDGKLSQMGSVCLDVTARELRVAGESVSLTPKEFELLRTLMSKADQVCRYEDLLWEIWGYDGSIQTRTLGVHIGRLRAKIDGGRSAPQRILTVPGVGYMFADASLQEAAG